MTDQNRQALEQITLGTQNELDGSPNFWEKVQDANEYSLFRGRDFSQKVSYAAMRDTFLVDSEVNTAVSTYQYAVQETDHCNNR